MFQRLDDQISINTTKQEVSLKPMLKPAGNSIKFPSHLCLWMGKSQMSKMKMQRKEKRMI